MQSEFSKIIHVIIYKNTVYEHFVSSNATIKTKMKISSMYNYSLHWLCSRHTVPSMIYDGHTDMNSTKYGQQEDLLYHSNKNNKLT